MKIIDKNLYYFETNGSFYEIGLNYGVEFQSEIQSIVTATVERMTRRFGERQIKTTLMQLTDSFQKNYPYLFEEIEGMCAGASITMERFSLHLFGAGIHVFDHEDDGCTDIIFPTSEIGPLLGKTHDATSPVPGPASVRLICVHKSFNDILCITRPDGFSMMTGLNDKGLAIGESSIHFHSTNKSGTIRNLLLRPVLHECDDVYEAVDYLANHPVLSAGFHYALVDKNGNAAIVEKSPTNQNVRWSKGEAIYCTNHTANSFMRVKEKSRGEAGDRNSDLRYEHLKQLTADVNFTFSFNMMKNIITYHDKYGGICQHGDPDYKGEKSTFYPLFTQRAFINIVNEGKLLVSNGYPCVNEFFEFKLSNG